MSEISKLFIQLSELQYPISIQAVCNEVEGTAFFPVGRGLYNFGDQNLSDKKVMILGQDFDTAENFLKVKKAGKEDTDKNATWRNLLSFLNDAKISTNDCFFTNAIMGVRKTGKGTGKSPAFKEKAFIKDCQDFFLKQLEAQKPKIILVLGKHVAEFIAPLSEELKYWGKIKNIAHVDSQNQQVINTTFTNDLNTTTVLLTHPSFRFANVGRRKFNSLEGNIAELEMIKTALKIT